MERVAVKTTQNISVSYQAASLGDRLLAHLIDLAIYAAYIFIISICIPNAFDPSTGMILMVFFALPIFFYHLVCEIFMNGRSFGKRALKLKVIKLDGTPPGLGNYMVRWIFRIIDIMFPTPFLAVIATGSVLMNGRGQRLGDIAAGTSVIKLKQRISLEDTIYEVVNDQYTIRFPQVARLSSEDVGLVKELLRVPQQKRNPELVRKLAQKIQTGLKIESDMHPLGFLQTILKDYNALES